MRVLRVALMASLALSLLWAEEEQPLVCATGTDAAGLVRRLGGEQVEIVLLDAGPENAAGSLATPEFQEEVAAADLLVVIGAGAEDSWLPPLLKQCGNPKVQPDAPGYLDLSVGVSLLPAPSDAQGPHRQGNPHYLADPEQGIAAARKIAVALIRLLPSRQERIEKELADFERELAGKLDTWRQMMKPFRKTGVLSDHAHWDYLLARLDLACVATIEKAPGVAPDEEHLAELRKALESGRAKAILTVPWFRPAEEAERLAERAGRPVVRMAHQCGAQPDTDDYIDWVQFNVRALAAALTR